MRVPKEHGAWAMLYVPFVLGALAGARPTPAVLAPIALVGLAATALFLAREDLVAWWRARRRDGGAGPGRALGLELLVAAACGALLVGPFGLASLVPLAAAGVLLLGLHLVQVGRREGRSVGGEIVGILGLTLTAPAAWCAARGAASGPPPDALWLWLLCALYFASSIFHVKLRVLDLQPRKAAAARTMRRASALYHAGLLGVLAGALGLGHVHAWLVLAFAPVLGRGLWGVLHPTLRLDLRRAGLLEIAYSLVFLTFTALAFRQ